MKKINLAIIPARSQSKGIKDKNIRLLNGIPLIAYSIQSALASKCFDIVFVSTDSKRYAEIAKKYGARADFLRSKKNSSDTAKSIDVIKEVVNEFKKRGIECNTITLLQPTSPLRIKQDIINAFKIFKSKKADSVISVCEVEKPTYLINTLNKDRSLYGFVKKQYLHIRRQDFHKEYYVNGAIYIVKPNNNYSFYDKKSYAYIMDRKNSIDIDNEIDLKFAEFLLKN